jgi:hypothetical protein|tara:strand:- start:509 stop:2719 length:2211 start_codon:yes stop_codon:yes gene_type:complete
MTETLYSGPVEGIEPEDIKAARKEQENANFVISAAVEFVLSRYERAKTARFVTEKRWLTSYEDYRGIVNVSRNLRTDEKSQVFIKIPKTKTLAAYGQVNEVIFGANKFPLGIYATERPEGVAEFAHVTKEEGGDPESEDEPDIGFGYPGDGTRENEGIPAVNFLGGLRDKFKEGVDKFRAGPAPTDEPQVTPAKTAAMEMEQTIKDQLTETKASIELRKALFESVLYGTGIIKGPFTINEVVPRWEMVADDEGNMTKDYSPKTQIKPALEFCSVWDAFPEASGVDMDDLDYMIQRHRLTKPKVRQLRKLPLFNVAAIDAAIASGPNYVKQHYEDQLRHDENDSEEDRHRYEVVEYWGPFDKSAAIEIGMDIDLEELTELDELQVNIWVCNNELLRMVINPFQPQRIPYHVFPYERDPHEFFGVGVPENMADSTIIMNGHARMAIDNLALSGNLVFDIDETALVPGQPMDIFPGKIFRRQAGSTGQAVHSIKFNSTTNENLMMFDKFRQLSDEETGIPSYTHGQTKVQNTTRTAAGMSMLMGAAALNIKTVVKNIDDYLLKPIGEALYHWNMQFNDDIRILGDLRVKAMGTEALMQKEVRSQRLQNFLQLGSNPMVAPWINVGPVIKELAYSIDLDPEDVVNDLDQAKVVAGLIEKASAMGLGAPGGDALGIGSPMGGGGVSGGIPGGPQPPGGSTGTGNGNIAPANVQMPSDPGFSGAPPGMGGAGANKPPQPTRP